ncbi:YciI family protein [Aeromicrobium sp. CF4.19]|uniref:YciI family protein n=1 Tax=Aeromicrobium sp. CF4.19 TaxID=3373082 RepID=UPI003EE6ACE7
MPRFLTIGYGDRAGYDGTPQGVRDAAHEHDADLAAAGAVIGRMEAPVRVTNAHDTGTVVEEGPFQQTPLPVAGFALITADSLEHAIELASGTPCAVASGVVEVWQVPED